MKRIITLIFSICAMYANTYAIELHRDTVCIQLKTALEQTKSVEAIKAAWMHLVDKERLNTTDQKELAVQVVSYMCAQKAQHETELQELGDASYHAEKRSRGISQLVAAAYCIGSFPLAIVISKIGLYDKLGRRMQLSTLAILCQTGFISQVLPQDAQYKNSIVTGSFFVEMLLRLGGAYKLLSAGLKNYHEGKNYKQILKNKIATCDAVVSYLQAQKLVAQ